MSESQSESAKRGKTTSFAIAGAVLAVTTTIVINFWMQRALRADEQARRTIFTQIPSDPNSTVTTQLVQTDTRPTIVTKRGATAFKIPSPPSKHELRSIEISNQLRTLKGREEEEVRAALMSELKEVLTTEFQARHEKQSNEIDQAQQRLDSLKQMLARRVELKDEIVQRRLNQLTGEPDVMDWNVAPVPNAQTQYPHPVPKHRITLRTPNPESQPSTPIGQPGPPHIAMGQPAGPGPGVSGQKSGVIVRQFENRQISGAPVRVDASAPSDVFAAARRLVNARLSANAANAEYESFKLLASKNAVTAHWGRASQLKAQLANAETSLAQAEMETIKSRLSRNLEFSEASLDRAKQILAHAKTRFQNGTETTDAVLRAESAMVSAEKQLMDVIESRKQLEKAMELIERSNLDEDDDDTENPGLRAKDDELGDDVISETRRKIVPDDSADDASDRPSPKNEEHDSDPEAPAIRRDNSEL